MSIPLKVIGTINVRLLADLSVSIRYLGTVCRIIDLFYGGSAALMVADPFFNEYVNNMWKKHSNLNYTPDG